jgi:hypothetical protein
MKRKRTGGSGVSEVNETSEASRMKDAIEETYILGFSVKYGRPGCVLL